MPEIPIIDLSNLGGGNLDALVDAFRQAYTDTGFAYVTHHGINQDLIDAVFKATATFHALPRAERDLLALDKNHRGFIGINTSTDVTSKLATVTKPNQSESFMVMREDNEADPNAYLSGPNQWPDIDGFRATLEAYVAQMSDLGRRLIEIALLAGGADDTDFVRHFDKPTTWLRLLHYPPQAAASPDDLYGSAPHTDFGCLTFLAQDNVGGLQVMRTDGSWIDAPFIPGSFVVNVGDMLHRLSNGSLRSTPHRVINRSGRERYSCPFFFDPHVSATIEPLPGTGKPSFEPVVFGEFLQSQLEATYDKHKSS
ncbi:MAG: isopenicillin N synthase-like dioxygenase [Gammaproteobacteria bacterium]